MQNSYTIPDNLRENPTHGICDRKNNLFFFVTDAPLDTLISVAGKAERKKQMNKTDEKHIKNLLILAFEGGSNYWYKGLGVHRWPDGCANRKETKEVFLAAEAEKGAKDADFYFHRDVPLMPGGVLVFEDQDEPIWASKDRECKGPGAEQDGTYRLNRERLLKGFETFKEKYPGHYGDLLNQEDDADTGDCFLQCCIFGQELYG